MRLLPWERNVRAELLVDWPGEPSPCLVICCLEGGVLQLSAPVFLGGLWAGAAACTEAAC